MVIIGALTRLDSPYPIWSSRTFAWRPEKSPSVSVRLRNVCEPTGWIETVTSRLECHWLGTLTDSNSKCWYVSFVNKKLTFQNHLQVFVEHSFPASPQLCSHPHKRSKQLESSPRSASRTFWQLYNKSIGHFHLGSINPAQLHTSFLTCNVASVEGFACLCGPKEFL